MKRYFDRFTIEATKQQAENCSHSGSCDSDIEELLSVPKIANQFKKINPSDIALALKEYGAWDEKELQDIEQNKRRILWIACGDIADGNI